MLVAYTPNIGVTLPTADGVRSVRIRELMPLGAVWTVEDGTQAFDPTIFEDGPASS